MRPRLLPEQLPAFLTRLRKTDRTAITSDPIFVRVTEEPRTPVAAETTVEDITHRPANSPLLISTDSSDLQTASSTLVKKYEIGSGENKVNVRIYKEPPVKPIIVAPSRDAK
jgi:hypothetical protein